MTSQVRIEIDTPQHYSEPSVPISATSFATPGRWLVAADRSVLVVDVKPADRIPLDVEGILRMLQTHLLSPKTSLGLPAKVRLRPFGDVAADDVPVKPVDAADDDFREGWHLRLRQLKKPASPDGPWVRSDTTFWGAEGTSADFLERPVEAQPPASQLAQLVAQTKPGHDPLWADSLILSGGGASGELYGSWPKGELLLYRERVVTGRTTTGVTAQDGILYPFGLRASEVRTWKRVLRSPFSLGPGAYLVVSSKIVIRDLTRPIATATGAVGSARSPFVSVEVVNPVRDGVATTYTAPDNEQAHPVPLISYVVFDAAGVSHRLEVPGYFVAGKTAPAPEIVKRLEGIYAAVPGQTGAELRAASPVLSRAFLGAHGSRITYATDAPAGTPKGTGPGSVLTHEIRLCLPPGAFTTQPPAPPTVDWFGADLTAVSQFTGSASMSVLRYPRVGTSGVLLELADPVAAKLNSTAKSGVFASPSYKVNSVTVDGAKFTPALDPGSDGALLTTTAPRLLGLFELKEFVVDKKVSPTISTSGDTRVLSYQSDLKGSKTEAAGLFALEAKPGARLSLSEVAGTKSSASSTTVSLLSVTLGGLIEVGIDSCTLVQDASGMHVDPATTKVGAPRLTEQFKFLQDVMDALPPNLFGDGPHVAVNGFEVVAGMTIDLPSVAFGVFQLRNLTLEVTVSFLLGGRGITAEMSLGTVTRPFQVGVGIFVGGGHFSVGMRWNGTKLTPIAAGSVELGAGVSIDLTLASGVVEAVAGLTLAVLGDDVRVGGYVRLLGTVRVAYIGSMTVRTDLSLEYSPKNDVVYGHGSYTIEIDVWLFSGSVSIPFDYSFKTKRNDPPLLELLKSSRGAEAEWGDYWSAFALEELAA